MLCMQLSGRPSTPRTASVRAVHAFLVFRSGETLQRQDQLILWIGLSWAAPCPKPATPLRAADNLNRAGEAHTNRSGIHHTCNHDLLVLKLRSAKKVLKRVVFWTNPHNFVQTPNAMSHPTGTPVDRDAKGIGTEGIRFVR